MKRRGWVTPLLVKEGATWHRDGLGAGPLFLPTWMRGFAIPFLILPKSRVVEFFLTFLAQQCREYDASASPAFERGPAKWVLPLRGIALSSQCICSGIGKRTDLLYYSSRSFIGHGRDVDDEFRVGVVAHLASDSQKIISQSAIRKITVANASKPSVVVHAR